MKFSVAQLLEVCSEDKLVAPKAIEKKLAIESEEELHKLQVALDALERAGILEKDKGRYRRCMEDGLIEGRLRCSSKGFCFAIQEVEGAEDIYIKESKLSSAWNGDRVLVKIIKDGMRRRSPEGEVRLIVERSNTTILATVKSSPSGYRAMPLDDRLAFELEVAPSNEVPKLEMAIDRLVHLEITRYAIGNLLPLGRVVRVLGEDVESTHDLELVRCKHNLPALFPEQVHAAVSTLPKTVKKQDTKQRVDLRGRSVVQIGETLLSADLIEGIWQIGVHIPDVATYVTMDSVLDDVAEDRGRSFFLGEHVIPMLPPLEFLQQPELLTVSLIMHFTPEGELQFFELQPCVIQVASRYSYHTSQAVLDRGEFAEAGDCTLQRLQLLSPLIEAYVPAIVLELPGQPLQEGDDSITGLSVAPENLSIYALVSRLLIMTNRTIAIHLKALGLPAIFRGQASPEGGKLIDWLKLLEELGATPPQEDPLQVTPQILRTNLENLAKIDTPLRREIATQLFVSLMRPGEYTMQPAPHFGLMLAGRSADAPYCHGVFPQHRYADLLVQRLIHLLFQEGRDRRSSRSKEGVDLRNSSCHGQISWSVLPPELERQFRASAEGVLSDLNQQDGLAFRSAADLDGLRKAEQMRDQVGKTFFGMITAVQPYGFFVELETFLAEGLVHVSSLKDDWYEFPQGNNGKQRGRALIGKRFGKQYRLGDRIEVQVRSVDYYRQQIDLSIVRNEPLPDLPPEEEDYDSEEMLEE